MIIYDKFLFGKKFKEIRVMAGFSYKSLESTSTVTRNTLRGIERGTSVPSLDTLSLLSEALGYNLLELLLICNTEENKMIAEIKLGIRLLIERREFSNIDTNINLITSELNDNPNLSFHNQQSLKQLLHWLQGITASKSNKNDKEVLDHFVNAIKVTKPDFSLDETNRSDYTLTELEVLNSVSVHFLKIDALEKGISIGNLIIDRLDSYDQFLTENIYLYTYVCYNMSSVYFHIGDFEQSYHFAKKGINTNYALRTNISLWSLMFRKARAEFELNNPAYKNTLVLAERIFAEEHPNAKENIITNQILKYSLF